MAYQLNLQEPAPGVAIVTVAFKTKADNQAVLQDYCRRTGVKMGALMNSALNDLIAKITEPNNTKEASNG